MPRRRTAQRRVVLGYARWTLVTEQALRAPRAYQGVVVFNDKLQFGGGNYRPVFRLTTWCSNTAQWSWFSTRPGRSHLVPAVVHRRIWLLGGWSDNPSRNWNDVWYSDDGAHWTELKIEPVWTPRHEHSTYVFQDAIWLAGGNTWPLVNDVWRLDLPA